MSSQFRNRLVVFVLAPVLLGALAIGVTIAPYSKYTRGFYLIIICALAADLAIGLRGIWRNAATIIVATLLGLAAIELTCAALEPPAPSYARGFSTSRPVLGWGPSAPGVYHSTRLGVDGSRIYDVTYTIDDHLLRKTQSADAGPAVAFFGDSMTFGEGLPDSDTLPQAFADLTGRSERVLNFGFPGYGPQHLLRPLETDLFAPLLKDAKIFVYETAAWHLPRSSCLDDFVARAPRYELHDGVAVFSGPCVKGWKRALHDAVMASATFRRLVRPIASAVRPKDVTLYVAEFKRSAELIKEKYGGRLIVLYLPDGTHYLAKSKSGFTDVMIEDALKQAGIDVVDATLSPKDFPPGTQFAIPGDGHPTAIANRARAAMLKDYIESRTASAEQPADASKAQ